MILPEIDIDDTGAQLRPGKPALCQGNGDDPDYECCCDNCNWYQACFPKILFNRARCRKCGSVIESKSVHDFQTCACGAISVDGGREYIRRIGDLDAIEELIEYADPVVLQEEQ